MGESDDDVLLKVRQLAALFACHKQRINFALRERPDLYVRRGQWRLVPAAKLPELKKVLASRAARRRGVPA